MSRLNHVILVSAVTSAVALALALPLPATAADASKPDPWITTKVKKSLLTSEDVDGLDVNVDTVDGRVTLHGRVDSAQAKARAEELAAKIEGIHAVRNLLLAEGPQEGQETEVSDDERRQRVETVLARDRALEDSQIEVKSVNDGVVLLGGEAATLRAHRRALEAATSVDGVRHVASQISSPDQLTDAEIWAEGKMEGEQRSSSQAVGDVWITTKTKMALMTILDRPVSTSRWTRATAW